VPDARGRRTPSFDPQDGIDQGARRAGTAEFEAAGATDAAPGTLTRMPDEQPTPDVDDDGPLISSYGIASAVCGAVAVIAVALAALIWTQHREHTDELRHRAEVMQAAAEWTNVLINMNADTVETDLVKLHEGTVGQLNADFDAAMRPYRELVKTLNARTRGQVDAVAVEQTYRPPPGQQRPPAEPAPELFGARTDTVLVVATSISENAGTDKPRTVRWTLRLGVSDIDGKFLISRLEPIR